MMIFLFLLGLFLTEGQWIVLTNGKVISVDRYERKSGRVMIFQKDQVFSLPEQLVDWTATQDRNQQKKASQAKSDKQTKKNPVSKPPRKPIVLVDDGRKETPASEKAVVPYRTVGNSVVVSISINGTGPYDVILDTGASMTLIDPEVIDRIRARISKNAISLVGLGGGVNARQANLDSLSLGKASVGNFNVAAHQLPSLSAMGVVGLLGQDFLNHFVMELDSAGKVLTLTPHQSAKPTTDTEDIYSRAMEMLETHQKYSFQLSEVFRRLGSMSSSYFNRWEGQSSTGTSQELTSLSRTLTEIRNFNNDARSLLSRIVEQNLAENRDVILQYLSCYGQYDRFLQEAQGYCQVLRRGYSQKSDDDRMKAQVLKQYEVVERRYRDYTSCIQ